MHFVGFIKGKSIQDKWFSAKEAHEEGGGLEGGCPVADGGVVAGGSPGRRDCAGTAPKGLRSVGEQKHAQGQESGGRGR